MDAWRTLGQRGSALYRSLLYVGCFQYILQMYFLFLMIFSIMSSFL